MNYRIPSMTKPFANEKNAYKIALSISVKYTVVFFFANQYIEITPKNPDKATKIFVIFFIMR
ncbi:hypothetical protein [Mycoplasma sp. 3398]